MSEPKMYSKITDKTKMKRRRSSANIEPSPKRESMSALIVDNGAYNIKVGLSKDKVDLIPNCIMKAKSERKRLFIGNQINECRDCSGLYFLMPCERGYITKWDVQKPVWDHIFSKNLYPVEDKPVIMTQPLFNFKSIQDCTDEIFFEEYEVPAMFRLNPSDLATLRYTEEHNLSENASCIIVDSGFSFTQVVPYINGKKYLRGIKRLNVGGKLLTNHLKDLISYRQYNVMEETYVINQVKEDTCYVAENVIQELKLAANKRNNEIVKNYVLPDFNNIRRGYIQDPNNVNQKEIEENCQILRLNNERFVVPEILFHPSDIGMKSMGIAEAIVKSVYCCPKNQQEDLVKHVVLVGGNCKFPGFKERMYAELRSQLPQEWEISVYLPENPITYSWEGGGALLKFPNFKSFLVTKSEYEELGSTIIQQRFNNWMVDNSEHKAETKNVVENFSYLDTIKGKSIFGKQDASNNDLNPGDNKIGNTTITDKHESINSDILLDTMEGSEHNQENFIGESDRLKRGSHKNFGNKDSLEEDAEEDKLFDSLELFPFEPMDQVISFKITVQ
ncbi:actin-related protein 6 [Diorhabda sublineata]|uniref:actin-related protein 6 n=1 Tax=Diorhabda sublineata TaxID=1163346 RepID=UPI0024E0A0B2|nr:actin-related protein 6 [Diorhabda sublineata]